MGRKKKEVLTQETINEGVIQRQDRLEVAIEGNRAYTHTVDRRVSDHGQRLEIWERVTDEHQDALSRIECAVFVGYGFIFIIAGVLTWMLLK